MVRIRKYREEDFILILQANEQMDAMRETFDLKAAGKEFSEGEGITVFHDEQIFACMGIAPLWEGVGQAWLLMTALAVKHPKLLLTTARRWLGEAIRQMNLERVQADADLEVHGASTFLFHLGFSYKCIREKYYRGRDYVHFDLVVAR
jgi:hypothetical protein